MRSLSNDDVVELYYLSDYRFIHLEHEGNTIASASKREQMLEGGVPLHSSCHIKYDLLGQVKRSTHLCERYWCCRYPPPVGRLDPPC